MKVGVIDYGVGNLGSVLRALEELRVEAVLLNRSSELETVDRIILPGVGNFTECMELLHDGRWVDALKTVVAQAKPLLGVCVGMQLLASFGTEGSVAGSVGTPGLGLISGRVEHLKDCGCELRLPHVGWNSISRLHRDEPLFEGIPDGSDFYFVHSYAFATDDPAHVLATTDYGVPVTAAVRFNRVWGTQFHPEKSSRAGARLLRNFVEHA